MEEEIISPMVSSNNEYTSPYSINGIDINYSLQANIKHDEMASFVENNIENYKTITTIPTNYLPKNINSCSSFVSDPLCPVSVDGEIVTNVRCYKDSKTWNSFYKFFGNSTFNTIYGMQLEAM